MRIVVIAGRRCRIRDREDWQIPSRPVTGPAPSPGLVHTEVVHWPGASNGWRPPKSFGETAAHLRWSQDMYLNDPKRGYSYGYGFVIGQTPIDWNADIIDLDLWEVRGTDIRIASNNGDKGEYAVGNFNARSISVQLTASIAHPATNDQIETARLLTLMLDGVYGETLEVIPHRTSDSTTCPGDVINAQIGYIATRPTAPVEPVPPTEPVDPTKTTRVTAVARCYVQAGWGAWQVGAAVMGDFVAIRDANGGIWKPGDRVIVPGRVGVETEVMRGEGAYAVLRRIHRDGADTNVTEAGFANRELGRFYAWNGGPDRVLRTGDTVFWPIN